MKQMQTFKLDPELISELKKEAERMNRPFNNWVETILINRKISKLTKENFKQLKK